MWIFPADFLIQFANVISLSQLASYLIPPAGFDVELYFARCAHAYQQLLQGVCAFVARINKLLDCIKGARLIQRG